MHLEHLIVSGSREAFRMDGVRLKGLGSQPGAAKSEGETEFWHLLKDVSPKHLLLTKGK